jgi:fumarate reductase subunit C
MHTFIRIDRVMLLFVKYKRVMPSFVMIERNMHKFLWIKRQKTASVLLAYHLYLIFQLNNIGSGCSHGHHESLHRKPVCVCVCVCARACACVCVCVCVCACASMAIMSHCTKRLCVCASMVITIHCTKSQQSVLPVKHSGSYDSTQD